MEALTVWGPEEGRADEETEAGDGVHPGFATRHVSAHRQTEGSHGPGAGPGLKRSPDPPRSAWLSAPLQAAALKEPSAPRYQSAQRGSGGHECQRPGQEATSWQETSKLGFEKACASSGGCLVPHGVSLSRAGHDSRHWRSRVSCLSSFSSQGEALGWPQEAHSWAQHEAET